jgi:hypothetical protein
MRNILQGFWEKVCFYDVASKPILKAASCRCDEWLHVREENLMSSNPFLTHHPYGAYGGQTDVQTILSGAITGIISTAGITAAGSGYAANDTGTITTGNKNATYKVLTVSTGAVATFSITFGGSGYSVATGQATAVGGAQPGAGTGFTVNVTAVQTGDIVQTKLPNGDTTIEGSYVITGTAAEAISLALPVAGQAGQDGRIIRIISDTAFAHVVTTPANGVNGTLHILTFAGAVGNSITLEAYNGTWLQVGANFGVTVS